MITWILAAMSFTFVYLPTGTQEAGFASTVQELAIQVLSSRGRSTSSVFEEEGGFRPPSRVSCLPDQSEQYCASYMRKRVWVKRRLDLESRGYQIRWIKGFTRKSSCRNGTFASEEERKPGQLVQKDEPTNTLENAGWCCYLRVVGITNHGGLGSTSWVCGWERVGRHST